MPEVVDLTGSSPPIPRQTRSSTQALSSTSNRDQEPESSDKPTIELLPARLSFSRISLSEEHHDALIFKRIWLASHTVPLPRDVLQSLVLNPKTYTNPVNATFLFAQSHAGTAVCISPDGALLTCAHCVAEDHSELAANLSCVLVSSSGKIVSTTVVAWDPIRDLALLLIDKAELPHRPFPYARIACSPPKYNTRLLCIGHPGSEDLEAEHSGVKTEYDTLVLSEGTFRGLAKGQDPQDNSDIGALKHNCWTYWGHSGAGLFDRKTGALVGMHSSWDDEKGMRRGVPLQAVVAFLEEFEAGRRDGFGEGWQWHMREMK
ncbi:at hook protein family protein [Fusarium austroafricanum]|uniref:At hook protein family protein n=1 Tax=Fusarium austroafricanum TaxID=2364996 RepID=A0A8H4KR13_9HYPO|nr:at hook protein family protein [Fusarium austroafricanum]